MKMYVVRGVEHQIPVNICFCAMNAMAGVGEQAILGMATNTFEAALQIPSSPVHCLAAATPLLRNPSVDVEKVSALEPLLGITF